MQTSEGIWELHLWSNQCTDCKISYKNYTQMPTINHTNYKQKYCKKKLTEQQLKTP